jgi:hypothetical protein
MGLDNFIRAVMASPTGELAQPLTVSRSLSLALQSMAGEFDQFETRRQIEWVGFMQGDAEAAAGLRRGARAGELSDEEHGPDREQELRHGVYTPTGNRPAGRPGPTDPMYWINLLMGLSLHLGARLGLTVGFDHQLGQTGDETTLTQLRVFFEGEGVVDIPFVRSLPIIGGIGGGVALVFDIGSDENGEARLADFKIEGYTTRGEFDVYEGEASQDTFSFDVPDDFSLEQVRELLSNADSSAVVGSLIGSAQRSLDRVEVQRRFQLGGQMGRGFNLLMRRHGGANVMLSRRQWNLGADVSAYLTVKLTISGPDFLEIARRFADVVSTGVSRAGQAEDLSGAYEAVINYLTEFAVSPEMRELESLILDATYVSEARLRLQVGTGIGGAAEAAEGGKVHLSGFVEAGGFCEENLAERLEGGRITLRTFAEYVPSVLEDPRGALPNCPMVEMLLARARSSRLRPCPSCHEQINWPGYPTEARPGEFSRFGPWEGTSALGASETGQEALIEFIRSLDRVGPAPHPSSPNGTSPMHPGVPTSPFVSPLARRLPPMSEAERQALMEFLREEEHE